MNSSCGGVDFRSPRVFVRQGRNPTMTAIAPSLVHIVDADEGVQRLLTQWLTAAGVESRAYAHVAAFLSTHRADLPGCLVIDAQPLGISGLGRPMIPLPLAIRCPIVVTAYQADVNLAVNAMKRGAIDVVEKPLREQVIVAAVHTAIAVDRQQHLIAARHAGLRARFSTLTRRERQVMALVTTGLLNKQVGRDLGVCEITVKAHRAAAMRKMEARSLADLVRMADDLGEELALSLKNAHPTPARSAAVADRHIRCSLAPD
jgi:FixJ family two-component response regulator